MKLYILSLLTMDDRLYIVATLNIICGSWIHQITCFSDIEALKLVSVPLLPIVLPVQLQ